MRATAPYRFIVRYPRATLSVLALSPLVIACGGVNMSERDRRARVNSTPADGDPAERDEDPEPPTQNEAGPPAEVDAATPPLAEVDATPVVPAGSFAVGTELETTAPLNLREGAGVAFPIIVQIPTATKVKVAKISGADGWVNITYDAKTGYSSKSFLKTVP